MNEQQRKKVNELNRCTFLPGSYAKRFVRDMHSTPDDQELTVKQAYYLDKLYYNYRGQITRNVMNRLGRGWLKHIPYFDYPVRPQFDREPDEPTPNELADPTSQDSLRADKTKQELERLERWNKKVVR